MFSNEPHPLSRVSPPLIPANFDTDAWKSCVVALAHAHHNAFLDAIWNADASTTGHPSATAVSDVSLAVGDAHLAIRTPSPQYASKAADTHADVKQDLEPNLDDPAKVDVNGKQAEHPDNPMAEKANGEQEKANAEQGQERHSKEPPAEESDGEFSESLTPYGFSESLTPYLVDSADTLHRGSTVDSDRPFKKQEISGNFEQFSGALIILNALLLLVQSEWNGWSMSVELGIEEPNGNWDTVGQVCTVLEHAFAWYFVFELAYQVRTHKFRYFKEWFNWVDSAVVVGSAIDMYILEPLDLFSFGNLSVLRLVKLVKLIRTFKIIRSVKLFAGLRILVKTVASSIMSLFWSMVLLSMFMIMAALVLNNLLADFIKSPSENIDDRVLFWTYYGTALRAVYTMFEITMAGCWPGYARPLITKVSHWYGLFFVMYVSFVVFAVIRIITAIFLKETLDAASNDSEHVIAMMAKKKEVFLKKLEEVFKHADKTGDGKMSIEEFTKVMNDQHVKHFLSALELEVHESAMLFQLLDNGDGTITYEEFIKGVSRLKGQARALDLISVQMNLMKVLRHVQELNSKLKDS